MSSVTFPIKQLFPRENYVQACSKEPASTPILQLAVGLPLKTVKRQYEELKRDHNHQEKRYGLTALAVATMVGNHEMMGYLLSKGANRDLADKSGLTPFHFACALCDPRSLRLLGPSQKVSEIYLGWLEVTHPKMPKDAEVVTSRKDSSGNMTPLTAGQFQTLTKAQFYNGVIGTEQQYVDFLVNRLKHFENLPDVLTLDTFIDKHLRTQFDAFTQAPPRLYLGSQGSQIEGVFAGQDFSVGSLVSIYGGKIGWNSSSSMYQFDDIDAADVRNMGGMINDGFPNLSLRKLALPDGRFFTVFVAIADIKQGDPLLYNYSINHDVKTKEPHRELNSQKLEEFIQKLSFRDPLKKGEELKQDAIRLQSIKFGVSYLAYAEYLQYFFQTPSTLYFLLFKGVVTVDQLSRLKNNEAFLRFVLTTDSESAKEKQIQIFSILFDHLNGLSYLLMDNSKEAIKLKEMLQQFLESHPFRVVLPLLNHLATEAGKRSWRDELDHYPALMEGATFLFAISENEEVDGENFLTAFKQISSVKAYQTQVFHKLFVVSPFLFSKAKTLLKSLKDPV